MKKVGDIEVAETMTIIELNEMALIYIKCQCVRCLEKMLIVKVSDIQHEGKHMEN